MVGVRGVELVEVANVNNKNKLLWQKAFDQMSTFKCCSQLNLGSNRQLGGTLKRAASTDDRVNFRSCVYFGRRVNLMLFEDTAASNQTRYCSNGHLVDLGHFKIADTSRPYDLLQLGVSREGLARTAAECDY